MDIKIPINQKSDTDSQRSEKGRRDETVEKKIRWFIQSYFE